VPAVKSPVPLLRVRVDGIDLKKSRDVIGCHPGGHVGAHHIGERRRGSTEDNMSLRVVREGNIDRTDELPMIRKTNYSY
jgi:hypothetical protein